MVGIHVCQDLGGRVRWYSSLPSVGKPLMVVVTVQEAPLLIALSYYYTRVQYCIMD